MYEALVSKYHLSAKEILMPIFYYLTLRVLKALKALFVGVTGMSETFLSSIVDIEPFF